MKKLPIALMTSVQLLSVLLGGCGPFTPLPEKTGLEDRLAAIPSEGLPIEGRTVIYWDRNQIPYIEADHDDDAALALGLAHAHLRLGQMEILRRIAQGRLAEMAGPLATDIDHGLRILNFGRAVADIEKALPPATRRWLEGYVAGINHYQRNVKRLPVEFAVLGLDREPWTVADVLTIVRLAGTDVNWLVWFNLLKLRAREDWPEIWARLVANGAEPAPAPASEADRGALAPLLGGFSRSGSNSLAVSGRRSGSAGAILASDPHLGIWLPNPWLIVGLKSPSYHVIGLMAPGLPVFAMGRTPWIAWGGTNMRAASSELYDVSGLGRGDMVERRDTIRVRWWFDRKITVRETKWGPVLSDAPQLQDLPAPGFALRWTGHMPSDEVTAMLEVSRARSFREFRRAFRSFAVPGQNMLYADKDGNVGRIMAVQLPKRTGPPPKDLVLDPRSREAAWQTLENALGFPFVLNPPAGYVASANNRPAKTHVQVGYLFSPDDRVERMAELLEAKDVIDVEDIRRLQRDVHMASSVALRDVLVRKIDELDLRAGISPEARRIVETIADWDGAYAESSRGALTFELFKDAFTRAFFEVSFGKQDWVAFANVGRITSLVLEDIDAAGPEPLARSLRTALEEASVNIDTFKDWGEMHRLQLSHPLSLLPLVGRRYRFADYPAAGSTDTLMKTAHAATSRRHATRYGSTARHISDLSDPDLNYFVLLGGQDGWLNSSTFMDQVPIWRAGEYIQLPLRMEKVRARSVQATHLAR